MEGLFILFAYTVVILFLTIDDRANGSRQYNTGGGKLSPLSGSLSIAAAWIWAPAFFVSSERGYLYGWQGLAWFIVPNVLCLLLFAPFADKVRRIFPAGVTLSGFMEMRYKSREENAYLVALYWDSEMFGRTTRTRSQIEEKKDYRKLCYELLRNPGDKFATKSKQKTFETYRRQFLKWEFAFDDKLYKRFYEGLLAGDPKGRTIRAIINHAAMLAAQRK